jgi:DNA-directed RNA polymerase specialized sigma24 family protein
MNTFWTDDQWLRFFDRIRSGNVSEPEWDSAILEIHRIARSEAMRSGVRSSILEDVLQDVLKSVYKSLSQSKVPWSINSWVRTITRRRVGSVEQRESRATRSRLDDLSDVQALDEPHPDKLARIEEIKARTKRVRTEILDTKKSQLAPQHQRILRRAYLESQPDDTDEVVARELGYATSSYRTVLCRAREAARRIMEQDLAASATAEPRRYQR